MIERIQSFTSKVEAYLIAFVLTLGLLMMASIPAASADDTTTPGEELSTSGDTTTWDWNSEDTSEECGDLDGDHECDTLPED